MEPISKNSSLPNIHDKNSSKQFSSIEAEHPYRQSSAIRNLMPQKIVSTMYDEDQMKQMRLNKKRIFTKKMKEELTK